MLPCPVCGNRRDAHGVCRNCQRNEWEGRRSGRRYQKRPERRELSKSPTTKSRISTKQRVRSQKWRKKTITSKTLSSPPKIQRSRPKSFVRTVQYSIHLHQGVNSLLADVYDKARLVSDLLRSRGIAHWQIETLRDLYLAQYLSRLVRAWYVDWLRFLDFEDAQLLVRWYGLDGKEPRKRKGEHVFNYNMQSEIKVNATLKELQKRSRQIRLSAIAAREANRILQNNPEKP